MPGTSNDRGFRVVWLVAATNRDRSHVAALRGFVVELLHWGGHGVGSWRKMPVMRVSASSAFARPGSHDVDVGRRRQAIK